MTTSRSPCGRGEQHEDEDDEDGQERALARQEERELLGEPDDESSDQGLDDVAHAADHDDDEGDDVEQAPVLGSIVTSGATSVPAAPAQAVPMAKVRHGCAACRCRRAERLALAATAG